MIATNCPIDGTDQQEAIPYEVAIVMSALEAGAYGVIDRRAARRISYRVPATLKLFSDPQPSPPWRLYIRDINVRSLGFVTAHRLPLGHGGMIELVGPGGEAVSVHCTLLRCRQAAPGWFEGCLHFNREQKVFDLREARNIDVV
jgi:hypothetical protein